MGARVRIKGLATAARKIETLARKGGDYHVSGMRVIGEEIKTDVSYSRPGKGVPKETGDLMSSLGVSGPDSRGAVLLSAGGSAAPYALVQHERLDYRHDTGEARYWIRGLERWRGDGASVRKAMAETARAAMEAARRTT